MSESGLVRFAETMRQLGATIEALKASVDTTREAIEFLNENFDQIADLLEKQVDTPASITFSVPSIDAKAVSREIERILGPKKPL